MFTHYPPPSPTTPRQAQTVANFFLAFELDLAILPVVNKIDMDSAEPQARRRRTALYCEVNWHCCALQCAGADSHEGQRVFRQAGLTTWLCRAVLWRAAEGGAAAEGCL